MSFNSPPPLQNENWNQPGKPPGWYSDPWNPAYLRWWTGKQWTPHITYAQYPPVPKTNSKLGLRGILSIAIAALFVMTTLGIAGVYSALNYIETQRYEPQEIIETWTPKTEQIPKEPTRRDKDLLYYETGSWNACESIPIIFALPDGLKEEDVGEPINNAFKELTSITGLAFELVGVEDREDWDHIQMNDFRPVHHKHDGIVILIEPRGVKMGQPTKNDIEEEGGELNVLGLAVVPVIDSLTGFFEVGVIHIPEFLVGSRTFELVLLHEMAHALGLDHSDDPDDLMYPSINNQKGFSDKEERLLYHELGAGAVNCD